MSKDRLSPAQIRLVTSVLGSVKHPRNVQVTQADVEKVNEAFVKSDFPPEYTMDRLYKRLEKCKRKGRGTPAYKRPRRVRTPGAPLRPPVARRPLSRHIAMQECRDNATQTVEECVSHMELMDLTLSYLDGPDAVEYGSRQMPSDELTASALCADSVPYSADGVLSQAQCGFVDSTAERKLMELYEELCSDKLLAPWEA